ncbi:unnamed protein product [Arctia plantaginis]|uniref:Uncharacterized protein n=1 Tax=Arctia plantaginis TaxID=874455 RepID=A0A8S0YXB2_ARCPL|nr:unnamed protein product [Arctia plantaginis]
MIYQEQIISRLARESSKYAIRLRAVYRATYFDKIMRIVKAAAGAGDAGVRHTAPAALASYQIITPSYLTIQGLAALTWLAGKDSKRAEVDTLTYETWLHFLRALSVFCGPFSIQFV